jgi:alcohol dehydrogenase, propanol-preferring
MRANVLKAPGDIAKAPLEIRDVPVPNLVRGDVLLRVRACGVCRTDLHIVEGDLPQKNASIIPGHQVVAEVVDDNGTNLAKGDRVGVSWMGGVDGACMYCQMGAENLCDNPVFTGYDRPGGYAEYMATRADFAFPLPGTLDDLQCAPLLCAGIIGFRTIRVAGVEPGERVGLFGFGASAHLALQVLKAWGCNVFVSTRGQAHRKLAESLGSDWVGNETQRPDVLLDRALTFAPSGAVVVDALRCLRKGGVVAINAIHLDRMPEFDYDSLLWGERQIRSVANMTRQDARDFLKVATDINLRPRVTVFPLEQANEALAVVKADRIDGAAVITMSPDALAANVVE